MSLIEEALRRVQESSPKTAEPHVSAAISSSEDQPAVSVPVEPPPQPRSEAHSWPTESPIAESAAPEPAPSISTARAILITAALLFTIGGWWIGQSSRAPAPAAPATPAAPAARRHPTAQKPVLPIRPAVNTSADALRSQKEFQLSGIVVGGGGASYAVINGSVLTVGDSVGEVTLTGVTRESATLRRSDGTEIVLRISH